MQVLNYKKIQFEIFEYNQVTKAVTTMGKFHSELREGGDLGDLVRKRTRTILPARIASYDGKIYVTKRSKPEQRDKTTRFRFSKVEGEEYTFRMDHWSAPAQYPYYIIKPVGTHG